MKPQLRAPWYRSDHHKFIVLRMFQFSRTLIWSPITHPITHLGALTQPRKLALRVQELYPISMCAYIYPISMCVSFCLLVYFSLFRILFWINFLIDYAERCKSLGQAMRFFAADVSMFSSQKQSPALFNQLRILPFFSFPGISVLEFQSWNLFFFISSNFSYVI